MSRVLSHLGSALILCFFFAAVGIAIAVLLFGIVITALFIAPICIWHMDLPFAF